MLWPESRFFLYARPDDQKTMKEDVTEHEFSKRYTARKKFVQQLDRLHEELTLCLDKIAQKPRFEKW